MSNNKKVTHINKKTSKKLEKDIVKASCKCSEDNIESQDEGQDEEDEFNDTFNFEDEFIESPLDKGCPMVMIVTTTRCYIGAFLPTYDEVEMGLFICNPLLYAEALNEQTRQVTPILNRMFFKLSLRDSIRVRHESLIFLNPKSSLDKLLVQHYEKMIQQFSIEDMGLVVPNSNDIFNNRKA